MSNSLTVPLDDTTAFPALSDAELAELAEHAECQVFEDGAVLFRGGDRDFDFFVVKSGIVAISEDSTGQTRHVVEHHARQFIGDVDLLTDRPAVVTATARGRVETYRVTRCNLRRLLAEIPGLSEKFLDAFQRRRDLLVESGYQGLRVVGRARHDGTVRMREFLYKNHIPFTFYDVETDAGADLHRSLQPNGSALPVVACGTKVVVKPNLRDLADCLGLRRKFSRKPYDITILGAGPAGLAAAVYAASEGLRTLIIDPVGPGGQAGSSSRIENYMGFPAGLPGAELANRGLLQAFKFGAELTVPLEAVDMKCEGELRSIKLCDGQTVRSKTVLIAAGVSYRALKVEGCDRFRGAGVYYAATSVEARNCIGGTAVIIGGGNSAGQAAMYLAEHAEAVKLVIRGEDLGASMSDYLVRRVQASKSIEVLTQTEVRAADGGDGLERVTLQNNHTGESTTLPCAGLFVFIGATPHTDWLPDGIALDDKGFILTGAEAASDARWTLDREPCALETTCPNVFAAGDIRSGSTKRVAFAVGDGALAVTCAHTVLTHG